MLTFSLQGRWLCGGFGQWKWQRFPDAEGGSNFFRGFLSHGATPRDGLFHGKWMVDMGF
jgi:hypothetical protein